MKASFARVDLSAWPVLAAYYEAFEKRPAVAEAIAIERALL